MAVVGQIFETVGGWIEGAGDVVADGFKQIGSLAVDVVNEIGKVGQAAINDPIGTIAKIAAVATQQYWALPLISAASVVANGGDLMQAAISAGISYAGMEIASFASGQLASSGLINTGSKVWDTAINRAVGNAIGSSSMSIAQGQDIGDALTSGLYGGIGNLAGFGAVRGLQDFGMNAQLSNILGRTAGAATRGMLSGQDFAETFGNAFVGNVVNTSLSNFGDAVKNTDFAKGLTAQLNEAIASGKEFLDPIRSAFDGAFTEFVGTQKSIQDLMEEGGELFASAKDYYEKDLTESQVAAEDARNLAVTSLDAHKKIAAEFGELTTKYDEAKAAGDTELANSYTEKANALIPSLENAAAKYNKEYDQYIAASNVYDANTKTYEAKVQQLTEMDQQYAELNEKLTEKSRIVKEYADQYNAATDEFQGNIDQVLIETKEFAEKIEEYPEEAKDAFGDAFAGGYNPEEAYEFSNEIKDLGGIGREAYAEAVDSGMDFQKAFQFSEDVNSLPQDRQAYYEFASEFGLDQEQAYKLVDDVRQLSPAALSALFDGLREDNDLDRAMEAARQVDALPEDKQSSFLYGRNAGLSYQQAIELSDDVTDLSKEQQLRYMSSIAAGGDSETAMILALAQGFSGDQGAAANVLDQREALKTFEARSLYDNAIAYGYDPDRAYREVLAWESQALGPQFQTQEATNQYRDFIREGYPPELAQAWAQGTDEGHALAGTGTQYASLERTGYVTVVTSPGDGLGGSGTGSSTNQPPPTIVEDPITGNTTYTYADGKTKTVDSEGYEIVKGPSIQEFIDNLFRTAPPERKIATTTGGGGTGGGTGSGGGAGPGTGDGTGVTPGPGTGGTPGDSGAGTGTPGTGTGTGVTPGDGTGSTGGGTGAGTGGTGGAGAGGTGTGGGGGTTGGGGSGGGGSPSSYERWMMSQQLLGGGGSGGGSGIPNLTPGLTKGGSYELTGLPTFDQGTDALGDVDFAKGGLVTLNRKRK